MANKWTRRGRGQSQKKRLWDVRCDLRSGDVSFSTSTEGSLEKHKHYLEAHRLLPQDIEAWGGAKLRHLVEVARITNREADWERALILLAHHRSEFACDLLRDVEPHVPPSLTSFWELAFGESLGWLGHDYIPDEDGRPMAGRRN